MILAFWVLVGGGEVHFNDSMPITSSVCLKRGVLGPHPPWSQRRPVARRSVPPEALALEPRDLDPRAGTLNVRYGRGGQQRTVGMDDDAFALLELWLEAGASLAWLGAGACSAPFRARRWLPPTFAICFRAWR
ncbi:MAG: hypothetical protein M3Y17_04620 [Actinomycetota bacterium]|nr:hypothetical protein [Actinomycetota bacterium]